MCIRDRSSTPSSKVISSSAIVVSVVDSIVTTPCDSSPPMVHAEKIDNKRSIFTFLLPLLVEFWKLLLPDTPQILLQLIVLEALRRIFAILVLRIQYLCN